ncbi:DUF3164 family protein [Paracoccus sp. IB05]|uniref:DUF3164 family protein n=1 Tax=Paracoccus sp. IB05 TaxID=2779367 RepID=UPI001E4767F1|nr:DUF3164 family protein [Paracoccus sp. IB05]
MKNDNVTQPAIPDGRIEIEGNTCRRDPRGALVPIDVIKAVDQLEDGVVRKIMHFAEDLSARVSRFKGHTFTDPGEFDALLAQEYYVTRGGPKGNRTYTSCDGLMRVSVRTAELLEFGTGLQQAKSLFDECLNEWTQNSRAEIRAIVPDAFNTDQEGKICRSAIFRLLRYDIRDPRWIEACRALREAMRPMG